ncbi:MAG: phosphoribosyltransferase [Myxococcota bacterium]
MKASGRRTPAKKVAAKKARAPKKPAPRAKRPRIPASARLAVVRTEPVDEFGAAGGVPTAPRSVGGFDRSTVSSTTKELGWSEFDRELQALARTIARRFKPDVVVGLAHGGVFVGDALANALKRPFYPVHIVRRSRDHASHGPSGIAGEMPAQLKGKRALIVDDIASSGDSLEFALRLARGRGARAVATATVVSRPGRYVPDFTAFTTDTFFVFPWDYQSLVDEARFAPRGA